MKRRNLIPVVIYLVLLGLACAWFLGLFNGTDKLTYSQVVGLFENAQVRSFTVKDGKIQMKLHTAFQGKTELLVTLADETLFRQQMQELIEKQSKDGTLESYDFLPALRAHPMIW